MSLKFSVLLSAVVGAMGAGYNYDRCDINFADHTVGPLFWDMVPGSKCGNVAMPQAEGTPVNLCNAVPFSKAAPRPVVSGYSTMRTMNASNTGSSLYWYVNDNPPTLEIGDLAATVGRTTNTTTQSWTLAQIHPHWGRAGFVNEGSEHYIQGVAYPMEVHMVHFNSKYGTINNAVGSGNADALLVVGIMLSIGSTDLPIVTTLVNQIPTLTQGKTPLTKEVQVSDFFDGTGEYYSYRGSLTTPGCNEIVTWVNMKASKTITTTTLNKFKEATLHPAVAGKKFNTLSSTTGGAGYVSTATVYGSLGNYRPLQPIKGRTIYSSDGATPDCASFVEAQASCTSGAFFSGPSVAIQLAALALAILATRD